MSRLKLSTLKRWPWKYSKNLFITSAGGKQIYRFNQEWKKDKTTPDIFWCGNRNTWLFRERKSAQINMVSLNLWLTLNSPFALSRWWVVCSWSRLRQREWGLSAAWEISTLQKKDMVTFLSCTRQKRDRFNLDRKAPKNVVISSWWHISVKC